MCDLNISLKTNLRFSKDTQSADVFSHYTNPKEPLRADRIREHHTHTKVTAVMIILIYS